VFSEDLAWSVALTVASVFALVGVAEHPSWRRVLTAGGFVLAANLDRLTTGWACVIGAVLLAIWFRAGRSGDARRRWFWPVLMVGLVPLAAGAAVNFAKFGVLFGLPVTDQVWSHINLHREHFLAANHNSEVGLAFLPSNALAYLRPNGLRLTSSFPFITLPAVPARALFGTVFDRTYRTASMPASMPFLFLAGAWGTITAFRPHRAGSHRAGSHRGTAPPLASDAPAPWPPTRWVGPLRILLFATACAGGALLLWGYIANRYLADFVPFLVLAAAIGLVDLWRRADARPPRTRRALMVGVAVVAAFQIVANLGIAVTPTSEFTQVQTLHYVQTQKVVSKLLGTSLAGDVTRGSTLPPWAPADRLYVIGPCNGLYISTGESYRTVPLQQFQRATWLPVQRGPAFDRQLDLTVHRAVTGAPKRQTIPLVTMGATTLFADVAPVGQGRYSLGFSIQDPRFHPQTFFTVVGPGQTAVLGVITDTADHLVQVTVDGNVEFSSAMSGSGTPKASGISTNQVTVSSAPSPTAGTSLCRSLISGS